MYFSGETPRRGVSPEKYVNNFAQPLSPIEGFFDFSTYLGLTQILLIMWHSCRVTVSHAATRVATPF